MQLSNSFTIARPPQEVYAAFLDVDRIATCMPGSKLIGKSDTDTYEGEVKVKVGPLGVLYAGQFTIVEQDPQALRLTMRAKGREKRGAGNADAHIVATMTAQDDGTLVELNTDLSIRGKVAQFGRGVIGDVTDQIMQSFAQNVEQMLVSGQVPAGTATPQAPTAPAAPPGVSTESAATGSTSTQVSARAPQAAPSGDLDVWGLVIRPMLAKHASSIVTIAMSGLAAYLGARAGSRHRQSRRPRRRIHYS
ncbi:MAG: SRPBCC family protein [Nocardioidaceae bacterium]|nr:SRPBCC family protein [Nocardioidaceae bacterium]